MISYIVRLLFFSEYFFIASILIIHIYRSYVYQLCCTSNSSRSKKNRRGEIPGLAKVKSLGIQWSYRDMSWEYPIFICGELVNEDHPIYTGIIYIYILMGF